MKDTGISRKIDPVGRIDIPVEIRRSLKLLPDSPAEIYIEGKDIIIEKADSKSVYVRKIDRLGRFVVPREILKSHGINIGTPVEFLVEGSRLIVRKTNYEN